MKLIDTVLNQPEVVPQGIALGFLINGYLQYFTETNNSFYISLGMAGFYIAMDGLAKMLFPPYHIVKPNN